MNTTLTIEEAISLVKKTPENNAFDWKADFSIANDEVKQGEFIKDLAAIANASPSTYGYIVYGVDPRRENSVLGISSTYDDAKLQQLVTGKIHPRPNFLYYELSTGAKTISVLQIEPTRLRPHIITVDLGKIRKGQIVIRRGSSTDGVTLQDLYNFFYNPDSAHFQAVSQQMAAYGQQLQGSAAYLKELRESANQARRDMQTITGIKFD